MGTRASGPAPDPNPRSWLDLIWQLLGDHRRIMRVAVLLAMILGALIASIWLVAPRGPRVTEALVAGSGAIGGYLCLRGRRK